LDEAKEQAKAMKDVQKEEKKSREDHKLGSRGVGSLVRPRKRPEQ
jgi:hypothetical protein